MHHGSRVRLSRSRALPAVWIGLLSVVSLAGGAGAEPLRYSGTLTFEYGRLAPPLVLTGTGLATISSSSGGVHLSTLRLGPGITGTASVPVTDPEITLDGIVKIVQSITTAATGTFGPISGGGPLTVNVLPVLGLARVCLFDPSCMPGSFLSFELNEHEAGSSTRGLGVGGLVTAGGASPFIRISLLANPWTIGTASAIEQTTNGAFVTRSAIGFVHGPASLTSSTAQASGVIQLVTPTQVNVDQLVLERARQFAAFSRLRVHFVPEPGLLLLLGSGVAGLALLGRSRMKP